MAQSCTLNDWVTELTYLQIGMLNFGFCFFKFIFHSKITLIYMVISLIFLFIYRQNIIKKLKQMHVWKHQLKQHMCALYYAFHIAMWNEIILWHRIQIFAECNMNPGNLKSNALTLYLLCVNKWWGCEQNTVSHRFMFGRSFIALLSFLIEIETPQKVYQAIQEYTKNCTQNTKTLKQNAKTLKHLARWTCYILKIINAPVIGN